MSKEQILDEFFAYERKDTTPTTDATAQSSGGSHTEQQTSSQRQDNTSTSTGNSATAGNYQNDSDAPITGNTPNRNGKQTLRKKYSSCSFAEICNKPEPVRYLIEGYVQEKALLLDFGESGCGKTFAVLDQACSIACEEIHDWHGINLKHAPVIYFAGEGNVGLRKRCAAWAYNHNVKPENVQLTIIDEVFHLDEDKDPEHCIDNTIANIRDVYPNTGLIVIDTLHRYMTGDENKSFDIGKFYGACDKIIRELGCSVIVIHHTGNENNHRGRGSSSIKADVDIEAEYSKSGDTITINQTKHKDGIKKTGLKFKLRQVILPPSWNDEYGNPSTSCVIELSPDSTHNQPYNPKAETEKPKKTTESQQRARKTFTRAIASSGMRIHDEKTGHDLAGVSTEDWRIEAYHLDSATEQDTKRQHFSLDRKYLYEKAELLIKREIGEREYYCLDLNGETEPELRAQIRLAIWDGNTQRESNASGGAKTTNDTPGTLFDTP